MVLVDRKVSLPGDFDIKVAYIYPTTVESIGLDMPNEDVSTNQNAIHNVHETVGYLGIIFQCIILVFTINHPSFYFYYSEQ